MIIVDFSQVFLSNWFKQSGAFADSIEVDLIRNMILNSLRSYRKRFGDEYGELVLACDSGNYWRRDKFEHYKAHRKDDRESSKQDWKKIFDTLDTIIDELRANFPYPVIKVPKTEADDIIATLVEAHPKEKCLILSGDHDFIQLLAFPNVSQYDPIRKKYLKSKDPQKDLIEKIIRGDRGDGVPNILSDDDALTNPDKRQSKMTEKKLSEWLDVPAMFMDPDSMFDKETLKKFRRNEQMIDLSKIPTKYKMKILDEFTIRADTAKDIGRSKLMSFFIKNKMKLMVQHINDF